MQQRREDPKETRDWEEQKQQELQRQAKEDEQETANWEAEKEPEERRENDQ